MLGQVQGLKSVNFYNDQGGTLTLLISHPYCTYIIHIVDSKHVWVDIIYIKLAGHTPHLCYTHYTPIRKANLKMEGNL